MSGDNIDSKFEICFPKYIVIPSLNQAFNKLVHFSYPNILKNISLKDFFKVRIILTLTLDIVEDINSYLMTIILEENNYILIWIQFV
ncbi:hypothetical protein Ahy_A02g008265 isoform B [Arachis hypogaea]|uniref:ATP-dependent DNA helicase n=1 Tax=Arachis hypogaea TaxID=3818 RepID=A0A445EE08_ARAHY|nr:hypothetical protein Ahy_A02g008265 isoform B [Arachis hypogaea]